MGDLIHLHLFESESDCGNIFIPRTSMTITSPSQLSTLTQIGDSGLWSLVHCESEALSYPTHANDECNAIEDSSYWFRHRNHCIAALLQERIHDGVVLDVGGGNGSTAQVLNEAGLNCWLVEPGASGCHNARDRGIPTVILGTLQDIQFPSESVAGVGMFDVVEHIEDVDSLLGEVRRVLRPGGLIAVTVPAIPWLWSSEDVYAGHYRRYTVRSLRQTLRRCGFEVEVANYLFGPLVLPLLTCRALPSLLGIRRGGNWKRAAREHGSTGGLMASGIKALLAREQRRLTHDKWPTLGTSCIALARRPLEIADA